MLLVEQLVLEAVRGNALTPAVDYFLTARLVNGFVGAICVILVAVLARHTGKSRLVGLASALMVAVWPLMVIESRRGAADAPWLFFTLVAFLFVIQGRNRHNLVFLYLALWSGTLSFLFKYQSGVFLVLPFLAGLLYFRHLGRRLYLHLTIWGMALGLLLSWLIFDYQIFQITNTPTTDTFSYVDEEGNLVGLQSLRPNWDVLSSAVGGERVLWLAALALLPAIYTLFTKHLDDLVDAPLIAGLFAFIGMFYLLMSLFRPVAPSKWIVAVPILQPLALTTVFTGLRLLGRFIDLSLLPRWRLAGSLIPLMAFAVGGALIVRRQWQDWRWTYENIWSRPHSFYVLYNWFQEYVPQGGRVVSEAVKLPFNYTYAPRIFHMFAVKSIFSEPAEAYRRQGYEYLIWNSLRSNPTDQLADLDTEPNRTYLQGLQEMLRLTNSDYAGPEIVVYKLEPPATRETYARFGENISFRGYSMADTTVAPGENLTLTLYWMSIQPTEADLVVFVHIWDAVNQRLIAQQDGPPGRGLDHTWTWLGDMQFHVDEHQVAVPFDAPPDDYELRIGLYDIATGERLIITPVGSRPLTDGALLLQTIIIAR